MTRLRLCKRLGPWAWLCQDCFKACDLGLGLGRGREAAIPTIRPWRRHNRPTSNLDMSMKFNEILLARHAMFQLFEPRLAGSNIFARSTVVSLAGGQGRRAFLVENVDGRLTPIHGFGKEDWCNYPIYQPAIQQWRLRSLRSKK